MALLSRVATVLYVLGRDVERTEHLARLLRLLAFIAPEDGPAPRPRRRPVAHVSPDGELQLGGVHPDSLRRAGIA